MSLASRIAAVLLPPVDAQRLRVAEYPSFEEQLATIQRRAVGPKPWIMPSVSEALGVPAIFGAVSLIANTVGSLSLEAWRDNVMLDSDDRPRLIVRPNPFSTPRAFFRDTAFYLATRGEAWWWVAARDVDDAPMSLYPIPPWEITVAHNDRNRLRPTITWGNRVLPNEDVRQITYLPAHDGLRGIGPLQANGAAVSVTVESQEWAANFFAGSLPSVIGTTEQDMSEDELKAMDKQWLEKPSNMPRWLTNGLTLADSPFDPQKAQLTESRQHQVGEAARMFSMPGALIEYQMGGSSLTYQNQADIWQDLQRRCLSPHYLEPIEQEISDLLTRATVARFNLKQLLRADPKTRMEVHQIAIESGVYDAQTASREEGYEPGAVDFAPVPLSPPQAVPSLLPINRSLSELRCAKCGRLAGKVSGSAQIKCQRCGAMVVAA
ncbi:MAG TPA: phage portal protein [Candidatus Limnocylindria bacterium]|nr:phage portal protein [Candidatus Limnocylindria bacterium]